MVSRRLPPFSAVKAFEAAARLGSFVKAGQELNVTATAISQHVKGLEQWLGKSLFQRRPNGVRLTADGSAILADISRLLDELADLLPPECGRNERKNTLTISILPAFAQAWLSPRLPDFLAQNPDIDIELRAEDDLVSLDRSTDIDFAIRYGRGEQKGATSEILFEDELVPVATPYYQDLLQLDHRENWKKATLLHDAQWGSDWQNWTNTHPRLALDWQSGLRFSLYSLAIQAARDSLGILMGHQALIANELEKGILVALSERPLPASKHFLLLRHRGHNSPAAIQFRSWLLATARS